MMKKTVADIMNPKLLYVHDHDRVAIARRHFIEFGVTTVPVLDETHRPVGVVSLRELTDHDATFAPSGTVETVEASTPIDEAARKLVGAPHHHLVVVDRTGVAVGMVSSVDFVRAFVGMEPSQPAAFQRF